MKVTHLLYDSIPNPNSTNPLDRDILLTTGIAVWEEQTDTGKVRRARRFASVVCEPELAWPYYTSDVECTITWEDEVPQS